MERSAILKFKTIFLTFLIVFFSKNVFASDSVVIPSLMYHNINDNYDYMNSSVEISSDKFEEHMKALKADGYTAIFFDEYLDYCNGERTLPEKPILITFDDGYLNNYTVGFPILKETGMKATIFIVTGRMGLQGAVTYPHFNWQQAREMQQSGVIDIQSHTQYHAHLPQISKNSLLVELRKSKYVIEKNLNKKVNVLAYPYGEYDDYVIEVAKRAGYDACVLAEPVDAGVNRNNENLFKLKRITVFGNMSGQNLLDEIKRNESW